MIFMDFITVEMLFHAKALEVYTYTYHNLEGVNTQKDLEVFHSDYMFVCLVLFEISICCASKCRALILHFF